MTYINRKRRYLSLIFGVFFLFFSLMITLVSSIGIQITNSITDIEEFEDNQVSLQLRDNILQQRHIISTVSHYWDMYNEIEVNENKDTELFIRTFISKYISEQTLVSEGSAIMIISSDNSVLYNDSTIPDNKDLIYLIEDQVDVLIDNKIYVIDNDKNIIDNIIPGADSNTGNNDYNYFIKNTLKYDNSNDYFEIVIGFNEKRLFEALHHPVNKGQVINIKNQLNKFQSVLALFLLISLIFAIVLVLYMNFFEEKTFNIKTGYKSDDFTEYCKMINKEDRGNYDAKRKRNF